MGAIKGLRAVLGIILCLALGISVWLTVQGQVFHQEQVSLGGLTFRPVEEEAMAPTLAPGDLAVILPREEYALGDAVLCRREEETSFLRLVGTSGDSFIVRGDGEEEGGETLLAPDAIQGEVAAALPGAGTVYEFLGSWWGVPVILVVGILLLALPTLLGLGKVPRDAAPEEFSTEKRGAVKRAPRENPGAAREKPARYKGRHAR